MAFPAEGLNLFFMSIYGGFGYDFSATCSLGLATGRAQTGNPPYTLTDFLNLYPKFFGKPLCIENCATNGNQITVPSIAYLEIGQLVTGQGIPNGSLIQAINADNTLLTISQSAPSQTAIKIKVYTNPLVPLSVILLYAMLANACLMSSRWHEQWTLVMALFIAHYCTLWLRSDGDEFSSPGQVANAGLERGMLVAKSVDGVSGSYENMMSDFASWGAWTETTYGVQLITLARVVGAGAIYIR